MTEPICNNKDGINFHLQRKSAVLEADVVRSLLP
jgi:hypothetical protein